MTQRVLLEKVINVTLKTKNDNCFRTIFCCNFDNYYETKGVIVFTKM